MKTWTPARPLSWFAFLAGVALGLAFFLPMTVLGIAYEKIPLFLAGMGGIAVSFIGAAFMALKLAAGLAEGKYENLRPAPWRDQVW